MAKVNINPQVALRPPDLVVLFRLALERGPPPIYAVLASELSLTASEIHAGVDRAVLAQLARKDRAGKASVVREALCQFVLNAAPYAFPATLGGMSRGMPTGYAAPILADKIVQSDEPAPVWPHKTGTVRGKALRDDGMNYDDYVEQLTYLLFLKMADQRTLEILGQCAQVMRRYRGAGVNSAVRERRGSSHLSK